MNIIKFEEVEKSIQSARIVMNAYLRGALSLTTNKQIFIKLTKASPFTYEEGKSQRAIRTILLKQNGKEYVVIYNDGEATKLTELSSNELFMLCTIVNTFIQEGDILIQAEDVEEVEAEVIN